MDLRLSGKTAVVTGASRGIGLAITRALIGEGVRVVAAARQGADELRDLGAIPVITDLTSPEGPAAVIEAAAQEFGGLDILVNNVGAARPRTGGFATVTAQDWAAMMAVNFFAAVHVTRLALPLLTGQGGGSIITVSSVNAALPDPLVIDYSAAKAALANFCKALSKEVGPQGVRVNTISPGPVATDLWLGSDGVAETVARTAGSSPGAVAAAAVAGTPTGRFTEPGEVADLVLFLASPRTGNITGADFAIDGGLKATLLPARSATRWAVCRAGAAGLLLEADAADGGVLPGGLAGGVLRGSPALDRERQVGDARGRRDRPVPRLSCPDQQPRRRLARGTRPRWPGRRRARTARR